MTTIQKWVDLEVEIGNYCKSNEQNRNPETIRKEIFAISYFLYKYLQLKIVKAPASIEGKINYYGYEFIKQLLNYKSAFHIWNFNYTSTIDNILRHNGLNDQEISEMMFYPHGRLFDCMRDRTTKIIIGTEYDPEIMQKCPSAIKANAIEEYVKMKNQFQKQLDNAEALIIYGHAMGQTDADYFSKTLQNSTKLKKVFIISKDKGSIDSVKKNMDKLCNGIFMRINCYQFSLKSNIIPGEDVRKELDEKITKCFL